MSSKGLPPGDGRRGFLEKGLIGGALLAAAGAGLLATEKTRRQAGAGGPYTVLDADEASIVLAIANRLVPPREGFPTPGSVEVPRKVDAIIGMMEAPTQKELRQLVALFESALAGLLFDGAPRTFTASTPEQQDARLLAWRDSRIAVRRTGFKALKGLCCAAYYSSPETYGAVGYPGPPELTAPIEQSSDESRQ